MNNPDFQPFQVIHFRTNSKCLWTLAFAARQNYCCVNTNTYIDWSGHLVSRPSLHMGYTTASPRDNFITLDSLKSGGYVMLDHTLVIHYVGSFEVPG